VGAVGLVIGGVLRLVEKNNSPILLVFASVYGVTSTGTYNEYAPAEAPCRRKQIQRLLVDLFSSTSLIHREPSAV
jgi:hypothetical protein